MPSKSILFLTVFFLSQSILLSQIAPGIQWQKSLGGTGYEQASSIQQTFDSGYIVAGGSSSDNGDVNDHEGGAGVENFWIVKLNREGSIQWQKSFGGNPSAVTNTIRQTNDSGFIIASSAYSGGGFANNCWLLKLDGLGNYQWDNTLEDVIYRGGSISQTKDSGYVLAAYDGNYVVVKTDSIGNIQWQKSIGGSGIDIAKSIRQTFDGGYIVAGASSSSDGDVNGHHGDSENTDYWIVKLDSIGIIEWEKSLGGSSDEDDFTFTTPSIQQTSDSGYIMAGYSSSIDGDVIGHIGSAGYDYWVVKLNTSGSIEWQKSLGGSDNDYGQFARQTSEGGYIVAGYSWSNNANVIGNHSGPFGYSADYWIVKLNSTGSIKWQKCLGGHLDERYPSIEQTIDGGYIVAGTSFSGDGDITAHHGPVDVGDYWVVKLAPGPFTFNGNGNWDNSANWDNGILPPSTIPFAAQVIINPSAGGNCILNVPVIVSSGASLTVAPGAVFIIQGKLTINH